MDWFSKISCKKYYSLLKFKVIYFCLYRNARCRWLRHLTLIASTHYFNIKVFILWTKASVFFFFFFFFSINLCTTNWKRNLSWYETKRKCLLQQLPSLARFKSRVGVLWFYFRSCITPLSSSCNYILLYLLLVCI